MLKSEVTNRKFTKPEMRVKIAKDVIAQIKAKAIQVMSGNGYIYINSDVKAEAPLAPQLKKKESCTVCALGAMFMADIKKDKAYIMPTGSVDYIDRPDITKRLGKYFTVSQMTLIEEVFENDYDHKGKGFYDTIKSTDDDVLIAICENIIRNNGLFKPKQEIEKYLAEHPEEAKEY